MWCFNLKKISKVFFFFFCKLRYKNLRPIFLPLWHSMRKCVCLFFFFFLKKRVRKVRETESPEVPL